MKRSPWKLLGALAASVLAASVLAGSAAVADDAGGGDVRGSGAAKQDKPDVAKRAAHLLKQLDANEDGVITKDEVPEEKSRMFERLVRAADANGDGQIDQDELTAGLAPKDDAVKNAAFAPGEGGPRGRGPGAEGRRPDPKQMFAHADTNGDGKLDVEEMVAAHRKRVERMVAQADTDGDGALNAGEFAKVAARMGPGPAGRPGPPDADKPVAKKKGKGKGAKGKAKKGKGEKTAEGKPDRRRGDDARRPGGPGGPPRGFAAGPDGPPRGFAGRPGGPPPIELFVVIDTNKDGKLSREEVSAAAEAIAGLDHNNDGVIDMPEAMGHHPGGPLARRGDGPPGQRGPDARGGPEGRRGRRGPEGRGPGGEGRGPEGRFGRGGEGFSPERIVARIMESDADKDGKISRDEAPERLAAHFDDVDTNGDDVIDKDELGKVIGQRMREFRERGGPEGRGREGRGPRGPGGEGRPPRPAGDDDTTATDAPADAV